MSGMALYELVGQFREASELLSDMDLPAEVVKDTLDALSGDLTVKATNVARYILNVESMADAVDAAGKAMKARAERMRNRTESIRDYLRVNMQAAGITKIEATEFVLALKKNPPAVVIDDATKIPVQYKPTPPPPPPPQATPDKKAIADALKAHAKVVAALPEGEPAPESPVPGAHLEQATRLDIKL